MESRFSRFIARVENELNPNAVSAYSCSILEDTLFNDLAQISSKPNRTAFGSNEDGSKMYVEYYGISEHDAQEFLAYLRDFREDKTAKMSAITFDDGATIEGAYRFEVDMELMERLFIPLRSRMSHMKAVEPEEFEKYREQSTEAKVELLFKKMADQIANLSMALITQMKDYCTAMTFIASAMELYRGPNSREDIGKEIILSALAHGFKEFDEAYQAHQNTNKNIEKITTDLKSNLASLSKMLPQPKLRVLFAMFQPAADAEASKGLEELEKQQQFVPPRPGGRGSQ